MMRFLEKLKAYSEEMKETVQAKADKLEEVGYEDVSQAENKRRKTEWIIKTQVLILKPATNRWN